MSTYIASRFLSWYPQLKSIHGLLAKQEQHPLKISDIMQLPYGGKVRRLFEIL